MTELNIMSLYEANGIASHSFKYYLLYKSCISKHWNPAGIHLATIFRKCVQATEHIESSKWCVYLQGHHYIGAEEHLLLRENGLSIRTAEQKRHYKEVTFPRKSKCDQVVYEDRVEYRAIFLKEFLLLMLSFSSLFQFYK